MIGTLLKLKVAITFMKKTDKPNPVPFHGAKELGKGLEKKMRKEMKIK